VTGPLTELNSALDGLRDTPAAFTYSYGDTLDVLLEARDGPEFSAVAINVLHPNSAPTVAVPSALSVGAGAALPLNTISVADADANGGRETVTLQATSGAGTLTLQSTSGLSVVGNGSALIGLTGTLAQLNTALAGLSFTAARSFQGPAWLSVLVNDNGHSGVDPSHPFSGAPAALFASGSIAIDVTAVVGNSPDASISGPTTQAVLGTALVPFTPSILVSDPDAAGAIATLTLQTLTGSLSMTNTGGLTSTSGSGTRLLTLSGTIGALNTALQTLRYQAQAGTTTDFVSVMLTAPNGTGSETATLGITLTITGVLIP
jgi:hypothetical protein